METKTKYYIYKHDSSTSIDYVGGYAISENRESFRQVPIERLITSEEVYARSKEEALSIAKYNIKQRGL